MRAELKHLSHELEITTVYVTHDQIEAMTLADRVAIMDRGRIQQLGRPEEIYNDPKNLFVAGFIGSPAMNLVEGGIAENRFRVDGTAIAPLERVLSRDGLVLGVRPEDLKLTAAGEGDFDAPVYASELTGESVLCDGGSRRQPDRRQGGPPAAPCDRRAGRHRGRRLAHIPVRCRHRRTPAHLMMRRGEIA